MDIRHIARSRFTVLPLIIIAIALLAGACSAAPSAAPGQPAASGSSAQSAAAERGYILIGRPNPSTGPIAGFGEGSPWIEDRALAAINKDGGIFIKELNKKLPVKVKVVDTQSDPTKAGEVASKLVLDDKIDLMLALHTPDTVNPVSATCERYQVPCIALDAPVEAWLTGGPYKWTYHASFTIDELVKVYMDVWDMMPTNKTVGYLFANDPDGQTISAVVDKLAPARGYKTVDTGKMPYGTKDFTAVISKLKDANAEILVTNTIPPDTAQAWRQMRQQGYVPKIATIGKAALFPSDIAALGEDLGLGLTAEVWWSPSHPFKSSLTGETPKQLTEAWTEETKKQASAPIGFKYAGMEIVADVLNRAQTLDKAKLLETIGQTDLNTIVGKVKYNEQHYSAMPLVGGQWEKGSKWPWEVQIVNNKVNPNIPTTSTTLKPVGK